MNKGSLLSILIVTCLCAYVSGHAKLVVPVGWNPEPSTAAPCGGITTAPTRAKATWRVGETAIIEWNVVAGDGAGPVTAVLDTQGGTFTDNTATYTTLVADGASVGTGSKTFQFTVPDVACTGANKLCTIHVYSSSNWHACTSVKICNDDCNTTVVEKVPVQANGLTFCTEYNGKTVLVDDGTAVTQVDAGVRVVFTNNLNNTNVFTNGKDSDCRGAYKKFLCGRGFPLNPGSDGQQVVGDNCRGICKTALQECGIVTALHASLYNCDALATCKGETSAASSLYASFAVFFILAAMLL